MKPVLRPQWPLLLVPLGLMLAFVWCSEEPQPPPPKLEFLVGEGPLDAGLIDAG